MNKYSKAYRRVQKIRNWMFEFVDIPLLLAITVALLTLTALLGTP